MKTVVFWCCLFNEQQTDCYNLDYVFAGIDKHFCKCYIPRLHLHQGQTGITSIISLLSFLLLCVKLQ